MNLMSITEFGLNMKLANIIQASNIYGMNVPKLNFLLLHLQNILQFQFEVKFRS